ncbi:unnamed protein product [Durusdinium trenchii]|uniref:Alpha/beta hydrolase fold-3 domain-containing protein n=1 Tax=Durusdinium trenchii TaxID=1381693 RepID=A0ABP0T2A7_9DINO
MNWASTEGGSEDVRPVTGVDVVVSSQGRDEHRKLQVALELVLGGLSAGGHLAAMAALERGTELGLAGLVLLNPVLDLDFRAGWRRQTPSIWLGAHLLRAVYGEEALHAKSPLHQVRSLPFPTLILHGEEDTLIPLAQSEAFMKEMRRSNNECMVVPFPQVDHDFLRVPPELAERHVSTLGEFFRSAGVLA